MEHVMDSEEVEDGTEHPDREREGVRYYHHEHAHAHQRSDHNKGFTALVWANTGLLVSVLFFSGMFYQRVADVEQRVKTMASTEVLVGQIQDLRAEVQRLRDRLDKLLDKQK
jgi:hypothetical protein